MNNFVNVIYGTHDILDIICDSFRLRRLILFGLIFFIGFTILKKINKKLLD